MRVLALTCALTLLGAGVASAAEPSTFTFDAEAGAFPISAVSGEWTTPDAEFIVGQRGWDDNTLHIDVESRQARTYYVVDLSRHDGLPITPGTYTDERAIVIEKGLGCIDDKADYTIDRLELDDRGFVTALDGSVEHRCSDKPDNAFRAKISYRR
ncbi:hypothetical protein GCM10011609_65350 [Lentzea pudingi]|uniref:Lipoprotein n=1 Tax=Lentzea pudingi TaxID=1789439 RepID=A0ABQ2IPA7_9PSEU|nr:hypothetical protein [Lentzea pudingi]GGN15647.1 hypothetical protein GCM10011609_65350 [Lentzea pudingi]